MGPDDMGRDDIERLRWSPAAAPKGLRHLRWRENARRGRIRPRAPCVPLFLLVAEDPAPAGLSGDRGVVARRGVARRRIAARAVRAARVELVVAVDDRCETG